MKLRRTDKRCEGEKRQRVPYIIEWTCPKCGENHVRDFAGDHYLSNPIWGEPSTEHLYCDECDHEFPFTVRADVVLTIVAPKPTEPVCAACDYPINEGYPADDGSTSRCPVCGAPLEGS
jgi:rubrerythrin